MAQKSYVSLNDGSKNPFAASVYSNMRGVVDYGNLAQFAPFESGFAFFAVLSTPNFMKIGAAADGRKELTEAFVSIIEKEFISLDGVADMQGEAMDITDNITSMNLLNKTTMDTSVNMTMRVQEKSGTPVTKFVSTFLRWLHDPKTQAKTYGGYAKKQGSTNPADKDKLEPGFEHEVFNFLYVVTDSSGLNVEKAYLFLNAQPTNVPYSDLYNYEKGDIGKKDISLSFNAFLTDGKIPNEIGQAYIDIMVNNSQAIDKKTGKINLNSYAMDWSYSNGLGEIKNISNLANKDVFANEYNNRSGWYGGDGTHAVAGTPNTI